MGVSDLFRRWASARPQEQTDGREGDGTARNGQSRRRAGATGDRTLLWTEEPETCERCGRRLLLGELPSLMQKDDEPLLVCPVCVMDMAAAGYRTPLPPAREEEPRRLRSDAA